ncbi:DUF4267 domain-containing protein [Aspergillus foveolatus]|uniref:DUF4267 domain-containing protein n=1 Tax=Aspergillus foveolatus TaxID=210207 RepID=UPI003CCD4263
MEWAAVVVSWLGAHLPGFINPSSPNIGGNMGTALILRGVRCFIQPGSQYSEFGIPREASENPNGRAESISPFIFVKGIRELGYGIALVSVQKLHDETGLGLLLWIGAFMSLADAGVVLMFGRRNYQMVAFHLLFGLYLGGAWWIRTADGCGKKGEAVRVCIKAQ